MAEEKKPKRTALFRWKYAVPALILIVLVTAFNILFLDGLLKAGFIRLGELMFGAKVEIASVHFRFSGLTLTVRDVAVADKQAPMKNLFELSSARAGLKFLPLLSKKINIPELSLEGVRWGTARKTSGALPPSQQKSYAARLAPADSPTGKLLTTLETRAKSEWQALPAWENIQKAKDQVSSLSLQGVVRPEELETIRQAQALRQSYQDKAGDYERQVKSLDVQAKLQAVQPALEELKGLQVQSPQDAAAAKEKIENAQRKVQELQALGGQLQDLKSRAETDFGQAAGLTQRLNEWKEKDLQTLSSKLNLPSLSFGNLARSLVGSLWLNRVQRFVDLANLARKYMPARKAKQKKITQPRLKGMDVFFPRRNVPPAFWIQKISLSGSTGGAGKTGESVDFSGRVTDVTSDPRLLGTPTRAEVKGTQGGREYALSAVLDHTGDVPKDTVTLAARGLSAAALDLPASDYLPRFREGRLAVNSLLTLEGDRLDCALTARFTGLGAPSPAQAGAGDDVRKLVAELWRGIDSIHVDAQVAGKAGDLRFNLSSNLDKLLGDRLKAMAGEKLAELRSKLMAEINRYTADSQQKLLEQYGLSKNTALGPILDQQKSVQDQIAAVQNLIKEKQAAAQQAVEAEKKKAEEQLKKGAQDQLKKLFK